MDRFNEYKDLAVADAMLLAMKKMGTVILSAAMMPSGMLPSVQIATIVIVGLLLYAVVMLLLFIPVMVKLFGKANCGLLKERQMNKKHEKGYLVD